MKLKRRLSTRLNGLNCRKGTNYCSLFNIDYFKNLPGACSGLRLATANEIMPGTGPSSCMAFLSVSMAAGLAFPSRDMPLMLTSWSLVSNLPSREAAPPCSTLLTNIPRSTTPSEKNNYYFLFKSCQKWPKDYIIISNFLNMLISMEHMYEIAQKTKFVPIFYKVVCELHLFLMQNIMEACVQINNRCAST